VIIVGPAILTNLLAARWRVGFSLGWHIVLASLVGLPKQVMWPKSLPD
jgi:hypothetical protein